MRWSRGQNTALLGFLVLLVWLSLPLLANADEPTREVAGFRVYVHVGRDSAFDYLWEQLPESIERIREFLGDGALRQGEIHVVSNLNWWFRQRSEPERAPRWAQALALTDRQTILMRMPDPNPLQTLVHELSHLGVVDVVGGQPLPRWFLEGFAMFQARQFNLEHRLTIAKAALFGNTLSMVELESRFPRSHLAADLAYAQSFHFVRFLIERHGALAFVGWMELVAAGQGWREAYEIVFGEAVEKSYDTWHGSVGLWYAWIPAVTSLTTTWAGLALLAVFVIQRARRRRKLQLKLMELEERQLYPPDPDDERFG